jgi:NADH:ubiquinone oxidoreductase subunit 6 (subunit J)
MRGTQIRYLFLFFGGFISWHSENGIAVLALLILVCLGAVAICTIFVLMFVSDRSWAVEFLKVISQAMLAFAGAIIGAGASSSARRSK